LPAPTGIFDTRASAEWEAIGQGDAGPEHRQRSGLRCSKRFMSKEFGANTHGIATHAGVHDFMEGLIMV
jgi:hypothetical protein